MQQLGKVCGNYLTHQANTNEQIWVLDGDLADSDGAEYFAQMHQDRFIAAGIAEQNMVSLAAGLATCGFLPWVFSFAVFLCCRAYDQIRTCIAQTNLPVTLVGSHAGACGGRNGKTHVILNDVALMATLPHINIWAPADTLDMEFAVRSILTEATPNYLRFPRDPLPTLNGSGQLLRWIGKPTKIALITYGFSTHWALEAREKLAANNIDIGILHFCKIWPLDAEMVNDYLENVEIAFVVEDHYSLGGFNDCLRKIGVSCELISCSWPANWTGQSGYTHDLLNFAGLSPDHLAIKIRNTIHQVEMLRMTDHRIVA